MGDSIYLDGETELNRSGTNQALKRLAPPRKWNQNLQFLLMKAGQTEPVNHQFTPDAIALLLVFIVGEVLFKEEVTILEMGSGMGILGTTFLTSLIKGGLLGNGSGMVC